MRFRISAMLAGIIIAATAVTAQAVFSFAPPEAYGICLVCHGRDLFAQIGRALFSQPFEMSEIARQGPVVTVLGVLLGALLGALSGKEFRWQWVESKGFAFAAGLVVGLCALIISGCPMRLMIRTAYGELNALLGALFVLLGAAAGTFLLKKKAKRGGASK